MVEAKPKCYRVQEELLLPGARPPVSQYQDSERKTDFYLIIEHSTERYLNRYGSYETRKTDIMMDEYFPLRELAEKEAMRRHKLMCRLKSCGWDEISED